MSAALRRCRLGASTSSVSGSALSCLVARFGASRGAHGTAINFAKKPAKKASDEASAEDVHTHSTTIATGINIKKSGSDPALGPDGDYPDWLWGLVEPKKTLGDLEKEVEEAKLSGEYDVMAIGDVKRLVRLRRRAKIKANNAERAK